MSLTQKVFVIAALAVISTDSLSAQAKPWEKRERHCRVTSSGVLL